MLFPAVPFIVTGFAAARMLAEAQAVFAMRTLGMAGLWPMARRETTRMVSEKAGAFTRAGLDAWTAAATGQGPSVVADAWLAPIAHTTAKNHRRLSRARRR
ncbi:antifreeze protein [Rhodobacteraceae bacterium CCMM004]|nr:antifreeze protein [Rhodobacteraceae bacterium CCMM004]